MAVYIEKYMDSAKELQGMKRYFSVKREEDLCHLMLLHPNLLLMFADFSKYAWGKMLPVEITRCIDAPIEGVSKTNIHASGRAIDVSVRGWTVDQVLEAVDKFNLKYEHIAAISKRTGEKVAMYYHEGSAWHIHMQVRP